MEDTEFHQREQLPEATPCWYCKLLTLAQIAQGTVILSPERMRPARGSQLQLERSVPWVRVSCLGSSAPTTGAAHGATAAGKLTGSLGDANLRQESEEAISKTAITRKENKLLLTSESFTRRESGP